MQNERFCSGSGNDERRPALVIVTISPGSTSRTYSASIKSNAHVSDATTHASPKRPSASGRKPRGSRIATSASGVRKSIENAPSVSQRTRVSRRRCLWRERRRCRAARLRYPKSKRKSLGFFESFRSSSQTEGAVVTDSGLSLAAFDENGCARRIETSPAVSVARVADGARAGQTVKCSSSKTSETKPIRRARSECAPSLEDDAE